MASADWTWWEGGTYQLRIEVVKAYGRMWYWDENSDLYTMNEDTQGSPVLMTTIPTPESAVSSAPWRMFQVADRYLVCSWSTQRAGWGPHLVCYRYDMLTGVTVKTLDPWDQTGYSHSWDTMLYTQNWANHDGIIACYYVTKAADFSGSRALIMGSYDGQTWFESYLDLDTASPGVVGMDTTNHAFFVHYGSDIKIISQYSLVNWYSTSNTSLGTRGKLDDKMWARHPSNPDLWVWSNDFYGSYNTFRSDTGVTALIRITTAEGLFWSSQTYGLSYFDTGTNAWVLDYPNFPTAGLNINSVFQGYTGATFFVSNAFSGAGGRIYKRTTRLGGAVSGIGLGSNKLSIDRSRGAVYCTTYGVDSRSTDYWRVDSDLGAVFLMDQSTISGVYGAVHSAESSGVYCYGNVNGDLVKRSQTAGVTFDGWSIPSGVTNVLEASTLYSKRDNNLPEDLVITVTLSGSYFDDVYTYSGYWLYLSSGSMTAESQVRRDAHTFIGALLPYGMETMVDYSITGGISWESRDTSLPTITITDLEFA